MRNVANNTNDCKAVLFHTLYIVAVKLGLINYKCG